MEKLNQHGAPPLDRLPRPLPASADDVAGARDTGAQVLDVRSPEAFAGALAPGSLNIPLNMLPAYGGYFLSYEHPIALVTETPDQVDTAVRHLARMGYTDVPCYLEGGLKAWETSGRPFERIGRLTAPELLERLDGDPGFTLLDVRKRPEFDNGHLEHATFLFLGHLPEELERLDRDRPVVTFCGSGRRAMIAASYLKLNGFDAVEDVLGSLAACKKVGCPLTEA
jgi:hydroxyacylglutathione hydrolase